MKSHHHNDRHPRRCILHMPPEQSTYVKHTVRLHGPAFVPLRVSLTRNPRSYRLDTKFLGVSSKRYQDSFPAFYVSRRLEL
jgi:hypothetical protein